MADEADLAFAVEQQALQSAMAAHQRSRKVLPATGTCHYCGETLEGDNPHFCDIDCAKDYEAEQNLKKRLGL